MKRSLLYGKLLFYFLVDIELYKNKMLSLWKRMNI
ncbi:hypothetical protein BF90_1287 [Bacillus anthracis]|nr:hypothetical protein BF90_1287 [Bacillus anthracis]EXJ19537.1 hypothetical protein Y693_17070 [Bacillus anthracis str. 95014]